MKFLRKAVLDMHAYIPGEQPDVDGYIKLNQNENPYPPSPKALAVLEGHDLTQYPESSNKVIREAAANVYGVDPAQVMAVNGSDEILRIVCQACLSEGDKVVTFVPGFTFYETLAAVQGAEIIRIPFDETYALPELPDMSDAKLVFLPSPHAPSGTPFSQDEIIRLLKSAPDALVVIDEAYADYAEENSLKLLKDFPNMIITRTLSKSYGLAGLRVGLGIASTELISQLDKVRDYYNLDSIAQAVAAAAISDQKYLRETVSKIKATRELFSTELKKLGAHVWPSQTNFVLARFAEKDGQDILNKLKDKKILVRYFDAPLLKGCLRISVGTDSDMDAVIAALKEIL